MTTEEVLSEITLTKKFHIGIVKQSTASRIIKRIRLGTCSINSLKRFFAKFGYEQNEVIWKKTDQDKTQ